MTTTTQTTPAPARVATALTVWFAGSAIGAGALLAVQPMTGLDPELFVLVMLAPAIGAATAWPLIRGREPWSIPRVSSQRLATSLLVALAVVAAYFVVVSVARGSAPNVPSQIGGAPVVVFVLLQALGALTEEIGFRGVLLQGLQRWLSRPVSGVITGVLFGLWHVQYYTLPPLQLAAFILGAVALTLTMVYVMSGSFWQRMATCTLIHLGANLALAFVGDDTIQMTTFAAAIIAGGLVAALLEYARRR
ncbi:CPBP family intramembrane glutamic endopeptidase [Nocardioides panzhihuensis]|uniref:Membrane protease YdiL (CAAX protease family) n=1 Tax=Nocardioides panzhihuensis TaxID=860243 RepID=A0A7Z0DIL1_9ACTN|nr:type II CAAX endopeptidase family protein [Nocardioides panzhihuensis]NYI75988.1 membrane protease YdiL (CAAX protease family) [Nocardioides panzhihuensis]